MAARLKAVSLYKEKRPTETGLPGEADRPRDVLDETLLEFPDLDRDGKRHPWTIRHACQGTQIFGATGTGKTTGSGRNIALAMLRRGFGGLVLTAKPDEVGLWADFRDKPDPSDWGYLKLAKRSPKDVIVIGTRAEEYKAMGLEGQGNHHLDFLNYEYTYHEREKTEAATQNLVYLFTTAMAAGDEKESLTDPYWEDALRQLLANAIDLADMARGSVTLADIAEIIRTAPRSREEAQSDDWRSVSDFWRRYFAPAVANHRETKRRGDLEEVARYWGLDFAGLADRTRSVVVSSFTAKATPILRGALRRIFCRGGKGSFDLEDSHKGKVIIVDLPVKEYGEPGRFAQILIKTLWQRATERRKESKEGQRPVFLWADESQYFVTKHDMLFQQTARSKHAATVYLTQNISNYYAAMGGKQPQAATDSLLGNLQTKIFHANGDPVTNEWAGKSFSKGVLVRRSQSTSSLSGDQTRTKTEVTESFVHSAGFATLRTGGRSNDFLVDAYVFMAGRDWGHQTSEQIPSHVLRTCFSQS